VQETRQQIIDILKARRQATVDELACALDLTAMTVRHHLAILEERGLVTAELERGKIGRPHYLYQLTPAADELFPKAYHILAERVLAKIKEQLGVETARAILQAVAADIAAPHAAAVAAMPMHDRLLRVEDIMAAEGFRVRVMGNGSGSGIEVCNCAYRHVAAQHPEVCELDHALMQTLLGAPLTRVKHAPTGDDCCLYQLARRSQADHDVVAHHNAS
jgi:predicted ArsR family transcriptional regulator